MAGYGENRRFLRLDIFPPQGGGRSPRRVDPQVGRNTERPLGVVIVVVVVVAVLVVVAAAVCLTLFSYVLFGT